MVAVSEMRSGEPGINRRLSATMKGGLPSNWASPVINKNSKVGLAIGKKLQSLKEDVMALYNCCMNWGEIIFSINFAAGFLGLFSHCLINGKAAFSSQSEVIFTFPGEANVPMPGKIKITCHGTKRKHKHIYLCIYLSSH